MWVVLLHSRALSWLVVAGPDLRGHRLSEVRLWAVGRSADDVYDNRESYLKLAEKRKRLAFKIRATEGRHTEDPCLRLKKRILAYAILPPPFPGLSGCCVSSCSGGPG